MPALLYDGVNDKLKWTTLAAALSNASNGAITMAWLVKPVGVTPGSSFDALGYLLSGAGAGTIEFGLSINGSDALVLDDGGFPASTLTVADGETYILVIRKAAGAGAVTYSRYVRSTGTWTHHSPGTRADQLAATMLEIGAWQGGDPYDGYMGLHGIWEGAMSQAQVEALDDNWATSDWWNHAFGQPVFLAEMNVAGASVVDLAGNASALTATGVTLDAGESLGSWNFDGTGGGGGVEVFGAASVDLTFGATVAAKKTAKAAASVPLAATIVTAAKKTAHGAAAVPLSLTVTTASKKSTTGAASLPLTFDAVTAAKKNARGATTVPLALSITTAAKKNAKAALDLPLLMTVTTDGTVGGAVTGAVSLDLTFGSSVSAKKTARAALALPLSLSVSTAAKKGAHAVATVPLSLSVTTIAKRGRYGGADLPLTLTITTSGTIVGALVIVGLTLAATHRRGLTLTGAPARNLSLAASVRRALDLEAEIQ